MIDLAHLVLGATLVAIGVLAAALADRIRGIRLTREVYKPRTHVSQRRATGSTAEPIHMIEPAVLSRASSSSKARKPQRESTMQAGSEGAEDVVAALIAAGYKKQLATDAVLGCCGSERATLEDWTRAALRCARGLS